MSGHAGTGAAVLGLVTLGSTLLVRLFSFITCALPPSNTRGRCGAALGRVGGGERGQTHLPACGGREGGRSVAWAPRDLWVRLKLNEATDPTPALFPRMSPGCVHAQATALFLRGPSEGGQEAPPRVQPASAGCPGVWPAWPPCPGPSLWVSRACAEETQARDGFKLYSRHGNTLWSNLPHVFF